MKILQQNNNYSLISEFEIIDKLNANDYFRLEWDKAGNIFLEKIDAPKLPEKIYDVNEITRNRILNSFQTLDKNLGVMLKGDKGTGKSVDAKLICKHANIPKILITKSMPKSLDFKSFLSKIEQSYLLFIDEFEKLFRITYGDEEGDNIPLHNQNSFLSLMNGLETEYKTLFLFTINSNMSEFMRNRPSRIKYLISYKGISEDLAREVINDNLINKNHADDLLENIDLSSLTIDILVSILEEMNVNNVMYSEIMDVFNYSRDRNTYVAFEKSSKNHDYEESPEVEVPRGFSHTIYVGDYVFTKLKHEHDGSEIVYKNTVAPDHLVKFIRKDCRLVL